MLVNWLIARREELNRCSFKFKDPEHLSIAIVRGELTGFFVGNTLPQIETKWKWEDNPKNKFSQFISKLIDIFNEHEQTVERIDKEIKAFKNDNPSIERDLPAGISFQCFLKNFLKIWEEVKIREGDSALGPCVYARLIRHKIAKSALELCKNNNDLSY